jgi:phosphoglycolate phosphatase-like HAD superfamily hydrolase
MERLVLFDVDGTLTRTDNGYIPFNQAILQTFGIAGDIRSVVPDGNTDPRIVEEIFARAKVEVAIAIEHFQEFAINLQVKYANALQNGTMAIRALPGVIELLRSLSDNEAFDQGVVTGNFKVTARVKLEAAGLSSYLRLGAYGCDSPHRPDLPAIARERWQQFTGKPIPPEQCVIVGDTPKDLEAARVNKMKCILVGTGRYPMEELIYSEPDACLPDLSDTAAVVKLLLDL